MHVTNLDSPRSGRPVANQYEIESDDGSITFQSYQTPIARKCDYKYIISANWNYSRTTTKYFYEWLRSYGWYQSEIDELKKWLNHSSRKAGDEVAILGPKSIEVKYIEAL